MPNLVFIDTWGWLALGHRRDARHREINALYKDYVLDSSAFLTLFEDEKGAEIVQELPISSLLPTLG